MRIGRNKLFTRYLIPTLAQVLFIVLIAAILKNNGLELGYGSSIGIILIIIAGISSALWGAVYQCKYNDKSFWEIVKDFFNIRQPLKAYILVIVFLVIDFGAVIINKGFKTGNVVIPIILFLKAIAFGGIEEIGWRYTFQPVIEKKVTYIPAVFLTFICWGIWHLLFFYIDGSISIVNVPYFLLGLLTNCFILSALYAYSKSLWICVITHALINMLSQISIDGNAIVGIGFSIGLKIVCMMLAVILYYVAKNKSLAEEHDK